MEGHRIPFSELDRYLSVFLRLPPKKDRHRYEAYYNSSGILRIWIRTSELNNTDLMRLLKFKVRLPDYKIVFCHLPDSSELIQGLNQLVNHTHPRWLRWIRGNIITQVRLRKMAINNKYKFYIVIKEQWAEDWMKPSLYGLLHDPPEGYLHTIGMDKMAYWGFSFAVCYS